VEIIKDENFFYFGMMEKRKTIAVNTRFLISGKLEGIGLFSYEILKHMVIQHPEVDFIFLFDRPFSQEFIFAKNVKGVSISPPARHPFLWYAWFHIALPIWLKKNNPDVFLSMDGYTVLSSKVKKITVFHDLAFEHFPDQIGLLVNLYYKFFLPKYAKSSDSLIAVSHFTKQDLVTLYGIDENKINVVYNAAKSVYQPISENEKNTIKNYYSDGRDFFVFVGAIHPRKNVGNLLKAFDAFKSSTLSDKKLLLIGRKGWRYNEIEAILNQLKHRNDILLLGYKDSEETAKVVGAAHAMCYVSLFEGFGIPIIEAQQAEVPVITSNVSSMPEVAGDATLLINPSSVYEITQALEGLENISLRNDLIKKGVINATRFSWQESANELWTVCQKYL
jgi:glycosyltransferase involved in cell wall biosynthesis